MSVTNGRKVCIGVLSSDEIGLCRIEHQALSHTTARLRGNALLSAIFFNQEGSKSESALIFCVFFSVIGKNQCGRITRSTEKNLHGLRFQTLVTPTLSRDMDCMDSLCQQLQKRENMHETG